MCVATACCTCLFLWQPALACVSAVGVMAHKSRTGEASSDGAGTADPPAGRLAEPTDADFCEWFATWLSTAFNMRPAFARPRSANCSISPVQRRRRRVPAMPLLMRTVAFVQIPELRSSGHSFLDLLYWDLPVRLLKPNFFGGVGGNTSKQHNHSVFDSIA